MPAKTPRNDEGQAFVVLQEDAVYALRDLNSLKENGKPIDAGVFISIDGIDVFHFSETRDPATGRPKYANHIIKPGPNVITGWHKTNTRYDSFVITEYGKGAASQVPNASRSKIGAITVQFASLISPPHGKMYRVETGIGPSGKTNLTESQRQVGHMREIISVRYSR